MLPAKQTIYQHTFFSGAGDHPAWLETEAVPKNIVAWSVVSTTASETLGPTRDNPYYGDPGVHTETLQVVAPVGTFALPPSAKWRPVVWVNGRPWELVGTELLAEVNPFWSPGLAVTVWKFDADNDYPEFVLPDGVDPGPIDPTDPTDPTDPGDLFDPDNIPEAWTFNPYNSPGEGPYGNPHPLHSTGTGPYGTTPPAGSDYNPYADELSPYYGQGGGAYGNDWPEGESLEARNAYWQWLYT